MCPENVRKSHMKRTVSEFLFIKVAGLQPAILFKRNFGRVAFLNFADFFREVLLWNTSKDLLTKSEGRNLNIGKVSTQDNENTAHNLLEKFYKILEHYAKAIIKTSLCQKVEDKFKMSLVKVYIHVNIAPYDGTLTR